LYLPAPHYGRHDYQKLHSRQEITALSELTEKTFSKYIASHRIVLCSLEFFTSFEYAQVKEMFAQWLEGCILGDTTGFTSVADRSPSWKSLTHKCCHVNHEQYPAGRSN